MCLRAPLRRSRTAARGTTTSSSTRTRPGSCLKGAEVKSIREGRANLSGGVRPGRERRGLALRHAHPPYPYSRDELEPLRRRKLLLHHKRDRRARPGDRREGRDPRALGVLLQGRPRQGRARDRPRASGRTTSARPSPSATPSARRSEHSRSETAASDRADHRYTGPVGSHVRPGTLTWGCVASILWIEAGEASRRRRIVVKEPAPTQLPRTTPSHSLPDLVR